MSADFTPKKEDLKILTPFKMQVLTNFPYIEADFDALTNYQLLCKVVEYLNNVITNENKVTEQVTSLYNAYVALQNYVNTYFDTLDLQTIVDNKLDEMAESGELADMIAEYIKMQGQLVYNSVEEMKEAENIQNGSFLKTYGYYVYNDGGGALYKARPVTNEDVIDNMILYALKDNTLVAELVTNGLLVAKQLGAKGDGITDDTEILQKIINYASENNYNIKFTRGTYIYTSLEIKENVKIIGENAILKLKDNVCIDNAVNYYLITMKSNTSIKDMTFDSNKDNNTDYTVADTITTSGDNITIDNCTFYNTVDSAIMFSETINSIIKNCKINDSRDCGIYCNNNNTDKIMNSVIINNYIKNATTSGIAMKRGCRYLDIKNNYIINCSFGITNEQANTTTDFSKEFNIINNVITRDTVGGIGIDIRCGYNSNIIGNRIINFMSNIIAQGCHDINIESNILEFTSTETLTGNHYSIILQGRNVTGFNHCYNINVLNNIINETYHDQSTYQQMAIRINSSDNTNNINIINNKITTNDYGEGITTSSNVKDLIIKDNIISVGASKNALALQGSNYSVGNIIVSGTNTSAMQYFARDAYHKYFTNGSTNAPTGSAQYTNGDIVFAKYGSSPVFAWTYDGTNFKPVSFDT